MGAFSSVVGDGKQVVVFTAEWCAACKRTVPLWVDALGEYDSLRLRVIDVSVDGDLASQLMVRTLPTALLFHDGDVVEMSVGTEGPRRMRQLAEALHRR